MYTCEGGFCQQSYFISSELKLTSRLETWYSLWQWTVIADNSGIYEVSKRGPCCWLGQMGHFTPILHHHQLRSHAYFFFNFACSVPIIISKQMKCEIYGIFKSFFNLRVLPLLFPKFVQIFQIGPKCTINCQGLASFRNNDCF